MIFRQLFDQQSSTYTYLLAVSGGMLRWRAQRFPVEGGTD
jgi:hypothetical protein